jgi:hypothetical protein
MISTIRSGILNVNQARPPPDARVSHLNRLSSTLKDPNTSLLNVEEEEQNQQSG